MLHGVLHTHQQLYIFANRTPETLPPTPYETVTKNPTAATTAKIGYVFEIDFADGVDAARHADVLADIGATEIVDLDEGGQYRVVIRLPAASFSELQQYLGDVTARAEIESAEVVDIQLPVR